jgi:hypothetical protein
MITRGLIALLLTTGTGAAVVSAAAAPGVTLNVAPSAIVYGQEVRLSGKIPAARGGQKVIVRARACRFTKAVPVRTLKTRKNGSFSFRVGPTLGTVYSVAWRKRVSRKVTVGVAPQVSLRKAGARAYAISVSAGGGSTFEGMQALLQRAVGHKWRSIATTPLKLTSSPTALTAVSSGTARVQFPVPRHSVLRAVFPPNEAKPCYRAGISRTLKT